MSYYRRLPIYLLLDCSESMAGEPFKALTNGISQMLSELKVIPMALETVALSVITFANKAQQVAPLTDILQFQSPKLRLGVGTSLGDALRILESNLDNEVIITTINQKGDYKPICFILSDGSPTDNWEEIADKFRNTIAGKKANIIAVACGEDADTKKLLRITETVIVLKDASSIAFKKFFAWVTASVSVASQKIEGPGNQGINLPYLEQEYMEIASANDNRPQPDTDKYVYLHSMCVKDGSFYLLKYVKIVDANKYIGDKKTLYQAFASLPLVEFDLEGSDIQDQKISNDQMIGITPCPYCNNSVAVVCPNGHIHCAPEISNTPVQLKCPWCNSYGVYGVGGDSSFDITRSKG